MGLYDCADYYLSLVDGWEDPNVPPVVLLYDGIYVVRDDLLSVGTKARSADFLIGHSPETRNIEEFVYAGPATGYAQISLPFVCRKYNKKAIIFMANRSKDNLHALQKRGLEEGGIYKWIDDGMLTVIQKRARDYVKESPQTRMLVPFGLNHPTVIGSMIKVARNLPLVPREIWSVGGSGTLSRSLQLAFPEAKVYIVSTGHNMSKEESGRAEVFKSKYKFDRPVSKEDLPPFPSVPTYDAKAWSVMKECHKDRMVPGPVLFWNVGA
jgi:hypothetical protein